MAGGSRLAVRAGEAQKILFDVQKCTVEGGMVKFPPHMFQSWTIAFGTLPSHRVLGLFWPKKSSRSSLKT